MRKVSYYYLASTYMMSYISSIGTAVPKNKILQSQISDFMVRHLASNEETEKAIRLFYRASGISSRHSVIADFGKEITDYSFFPKNSDLEPFPTVSKRMSLYQQEAVPLALDAIRNCVSSSQLSEVTHLITVSCTGMYAPGIDIEIIEQLGLKSDIQRTAINFMGCYAAFNALKVADALIQSNPASKVLVVAVELCSIHLLKNTSEDSLLSNALFGDGAAAVYLTSQPNGLSLSLKSFYSDVDTDGKQAMAWHIDDFGFSMTLSSEVPEVIKRGIGSLTKKLLGKLNLSVNEIEHFAIHPGGKRILQVIEEELGLSKEQNAGAYDVMKRYGNMSSPTVLFVLKSLLDNLSPSDVNTNVLSFAFGPGLTMESMLLKVHQP